MRTARWKANDADGDPLRYQLEYRGLDETTFKPLAQNLKESYFSWDETAMPDGYYVLRVTVSDGLANVQDRARDTSRESEPFLVDLTPPSVSIDAKRLKRGRARFSVRATDAASRVRDAEYSLDGGDWRLTLPLDGIFDGQQEELLIELDRLEPGEHTLVVRAADEARNVGSGKLVFVVD